MLDKINIKNIFNNKEVENLIDNEINYDKYMSIRNKDIFLTKLLQKKNGKKYTGEILPSSYYNTFDIYINTYNIPDKYINKILNMFDVANVRHLNIKQFWEFMDILRFSTSGLFRFGFESAIRKICKKYNIQEEINFEDLIDFECIEDKNLKKEV